MHEDVGMSAERDTEENDEKESEILDVCTVETCLHAKVKSEIILVVKGRWLTFLCDTGACRTLIHPLDMKKVKKKV